MPRGPKRTAIQRERDLADVASLYLQGRTQAEIAEKLEVSQPQISYDLGILRKRWQASALRDLDAAKAEELAKVDNLELTYWRAWEQSLETFEATVTEKVTSGANQKGAGTRLKAYMRKEDRNGDPRYLAGVQWCINKRCEILGLDAPKQHEHAGKDGKAIETKTNVSIDLSKLTTTQLDALIAAAESLSPQG